MEEVDCERMEEKDVLHTADELIDFVELYNGKRNGALLDVTTFRSVLHFMWSTC